MTKREFNVLDEIDEVSGIRSIAIVSIVLLTSIRSVNDWAYDVNDYYKYMWGNIWRPSS
jgi:hypothetical protein